MLENNFKTLSFPKKNIDNKNSLILRQKELVKILNEYAYHYYVLEKPLVSDYDYDVLYDELTELEETTKIVLDDSPTRRVGGEVLSGFKKVEHPIKLFSLNKCSDLKGLEKFVNDVSSVVKNPSFIVEYKFDGLRILAKYSKGKLVQASTRGNGIIGEDVTEQVKTIKSVPLSIDFQGDLLVAGEGIILLSNLEKYNKTAVEKLKNARNAVAGAIRNLDPKITAKRNLDVVFYDIAVIEGDFLKTQQDVGNFLRENKFLTGGLFQVCKTAKDIEKIVKRIDEERAHIDILIDGLVVKLDSLSQRDEIGFTSKFPKWAIAFKFAPQERTSMLKHVEWNVGRTGKVTPTAIIEPVSLAGATVSRATLNNYDDIKRKNIKLNSLVFIRRSNEVIPEILGLAKEGKDAKSIEKIDKCPSCKSPLVQIGPNLFCKNKDCKEKIISNIVYFASRNCMNIEGLSDKITLQLFEKELVRKPSDLYKLKEEDLLKLEGFKIKKTKNLISSIEKSKICHLNNFIDAISIDGVGEKTAKDLAKKFNTLENLKNASVEELLEVKDVGDVIARNIKTFFDIESNKEEINNLLSLGVNIKTTQRKINKDNFFYAKKVVLTGTLQNFKRSEAASLLENLGAEIVSSVSKNTDLVIVGEEAGSKLTKAKKLKIKTLNEEQFVRYIDLSKE